MSDSERPPKAAGRSLAFRSIGHRVGFEGRVIRAGAERFRFDDGQEVERDRVWHPGAVGILALGEDVDRKTDSVWLVRQPREVIGAPDSLEIPAGKRDVPGEPPLETAKRELAEEIGKQASDWSELLDFYPTPGVADEHIQLYVACGLTDVASAMHADEDERIEVVRWPLARLDAAIDETRDAKTLIALLWLARRRTG